MRLPIPEAGKSITVVELRVDGTVTGSITTNLDGTVDYVDEEDMSSSASGETWVDSDDDSLDLLRKIKTNGCDFSDYSLKSYQLGDTWKYYIGDGVQPAGGTKFDYEGASLPAEGAWESEGTPCFDTDQYTFPGYQFKGFDTRESDISDDGECHQNHDLVNTLDAGDLNYGAVATTCIWSTSYGLIEQADTELNTVDHNFTYHPLADGCNYAYDVQSVLTHEFGHVAGLAHVFVDDGAKYQTMVSAGVPCTRFMRTLGRSDVLGMKAQY